MQITQEEFKHECWCGKPLPPDVEFCSPECAAEFKAVCDYADQEEL